MQYASAAVLCVRGRGAHLNHMYTATTTFFFREDCAILDVQLQCHGMMRGQQGTTCAWLPVGQLALLRSAVYDVMPERDHPPFSDRFAGRGNRMVSCCEIPQACPSQRRSALEVLFRFYSMIHGAAYDTKNYPQTVIGIQQPSLTQHAERITRNRFWPHEYGANILDTVVPRLSSIHAIEDALHNIG